MIGCPHPDLLSRWRRQVAARRKRQYDPRPRRNCAMSYRTHGPVVDGFVEVEGLVLAILYDEPSLRRLPAIRFAGYCGARVEWGVKFGGPEHCRFFKDLSLQPEENARQMQLDLDATELLQMALKLDNRVLYVDSPRACRPRIPRLWAGFRPKDGLLLDGDGPELDRAAERARVSPGRMLKRLCRQYEGLVLFPLAWVSKHWAKAVTVLAELRGFPSLQVFQLTDPQTDLCGYVGAAEYDFYHSRFRAVATTPAAPSDVAVAG